MEVLGSAFQAAKSHPYLLVGGVVAVLLFFQLKKGNVASATPATGGVYTAAMDPALIASQQATTQTQLAATVANNQTAANLQFGLAQISAAQDIANKQTAAALAIATAKNATNTATGTNEPLAQALQSAHDMELKKQITADLVHNSFSGYLQDHGAGYSAAISNLPATLAETLKTAGLAA
jgi:hypothetical protein